MFKESISEIFLAPEVTASAIEANVRIGNAYVELIAREHEKIDIAAMRNKYGTFDNGSVSDATARTLQLVELLKKNGRADAAEAAHAAQSDDNAKTASEDDDVPSGFVGRIIGLVLGINKWILISSVLLVAASIGIMIWADNAEEVVSTTGVTTVELANSPFREHVKLAKLSSGVLYAQMLPTWDTLPKDRREEYLKGLFDEGKSKGATQVVLLGKDGKTIGFASSTRTEVGMP
jgi:hypothetical protein